MIDHKYLACQFCKYYNDEQLCDLPEYSCTWTYYKENESNKPKILFSKRAIRNLKKIAKKKGKTLDEAKEHFAKEIRKKYNERRGI